MTSALNQWCGNMAKRPVLAVTLSVLWLILIGGIAYIWHLGSIGLVDETEPLFAEASRQMLVTGDWITPFFNGETRFDKPALIYWCQAIAYAAIGVNEWAVRLPSALAAIGLISLAFYTLVWQQAQEDRLLQLHHSNRRWLVAGLATAMIAFNPQMIVWGRIGVSDMLLTGCIASALLCFFLGYASNDPKFSSHRKSTRNKFSILSFFPSGWYLAFYILIGAAILTKGPVGIVLPGLIVCLFLFYLGNFIKVWQEAKPLGGLLIVAAIALPWYILVALQNGSNYIDSFFGYHNVERFTSVVNRHSAPWYFYFVVVLVGFAPYAVYLPAAMAKLNFWNLKYWRSQPRSQQLGLFALTWFLGVFGFFTIAVTKLPSYVLPLMPAAAILIALFWGDCMISSAKSQASESRNFSSPTSNSKASNSKTSIFWSGWFNVAFSSILAVVLYYIPQIIGEDPAAPDFRELLQQSGYNIIGSIIWLICAIALAVLLIRRTWRPLIAVNLVAFAAFFLLVLTPSLYLMDSQRQLPLRELSALAVQNQQPGEELMMVGFKKPTVVFYTQSPVNYIKQNRAAGEYIQKQKLQKEENQASQTQESSSDSILIITQPKKLPKMGLKASDYQDLGRKGAYQLIRVPLT
ncbi:ArnT family glycosyltransferase [Mastigocoleus testarum]|uniref:Glycosyltransferase n=1 Tax=Mastigocoleus testarum BC008 TaxID=371196 RepID=A0A0V7ZCB5_9CYAN|nr:glycosyltransferase family 39 protein [Mastigocoleus testarum]KST62146.1 glycosyltransferase [Mastigocoleus testarum BC008]